MKTRSKKVLSLILSVMLIISTMPIMAFAEGESGTGDYYQKITSTSQMVSGAKFLIVSEWECVALDGSLGEDMDSVGNNIEVDFSGDRIAATNELDDAAFEIDASAGTIKSVSGYYIGSHDSQNKLLTSTTSDFVNEISFDDGDFVASHEGTNGTYQLQFNPASGQERFRFFKSSQSAVQLYMRVDTPVSYVDASGEAQEPIADYTTLTNNVTEWTNGWYVLKNNVTYGGKVEVKGNNVNLILCDGATLNANKGVLIYEGYSLTIWAQKNGTGTLIAKGNGDNSHEGAGIGSSWDSGTHKVGGAIVKNTAGELTVNGGIINATGAVNCAGIGGSNERSASIITINGGTVTAQGGANGAGIGGGSLGNGETININGGNVTATGGANGAGIGSGYGGGESRITIGGGVVQAQGGDNAAGIGAGYGGGYGFVRFDGGIVNAERGVGNRTAAVGGYGYSLRFNYTEPGYDMRITASGYAGPTSAKFEKPFISFGSSKTRTYNGAIYTKNIPETIVPKTAGIWNVTFDKNGGTGSMESEEVAGGTYTLPECDFTAPSSEEPFVCWSVKVGDNDTEYKQPGEKLLVNADTTVTAIWKTEYTVSFENGGGSGTMNSETVTSFDTYTLPESGFTAPTGKTFGGWLVKTQGKSAKTMQPGDEIVVSDNTTVKAIWGASITTWKQLVDTVAEAEDGDTIYLGQNLTAESNDFEVTVSGDKSVTVDLNGYTLDRNQTGALVFGSAFKIEAGSTLTVCDSSSGKTGTITGAYVFKGGAFFNEGTLIVKDITITDNHTNDVDNSSFDFIGGAIYNEGTLTVTDVEISDNYSGDNGGAIYNTSSGTATLNRVTFKENESVNYYGGAIANEGTLTLNKCTFKDNTAKENGGAIYNSGSVTVTGGKFAENTAKDAGAIYNTASGTLTMNGVSVHSNTTTVRGGGAITNYGSATLTDCDVWGNSAKTNGGAIWSGGSDSASLTVTNCDISSNSCEQTGGGICLRQGVLNASGSTFSNNSATNGGGLIVYDGATANLGGNGNIFYGNEATTNGGGIMNNGTLRATTMLLVQENHSSGIGGGVYNANTMSVQDIVTIQDNKSDNLGDNLYLTDGKVVTLSKSLLAAAIEVEAENPDQFITSGWYENHHSANPETYFKALSYYTVYMPDGSTELKLKKSDDFPYNDTASMWATDTNSSDYRTGVNYTIYNLTSGTKCNFSNTPATQYIVSDGVTRKSCQSSANNNVTGVSTGTLVIDRSKLDKVEQTGMYIKYNPFIFTPLGGVRWGIQLFPYSENAPENLGSLGNTVGKTVELTGTNDNNYTYQLHFGTVDGELRCAETAGGDFTSEATAVTGQDKTYGPYYWYITGGAPAAGESVKLRVAAICCSRQNASNLQMLTEWTDIEIIGTCSHSNGHLKEVSATAPTCTHTGNSKYWECDVCGKYFSDANAETEIEKDSWEIAPTGHHYAEAAAADWTWTKYGDTYTAAVTLNCESGDDTQTVDATVEKTAESDGTAVYTATATIGEGVKEQTFNATMPTVYHSVTGYIDANGNTVTADKATAAEGQTVTLTVTPASGYGLKAMTISNGGDITAGANSTFTFVMPDEDIAVDAEFAQKYTVATVTDGNGTVTADNANAFAGDTVTLTVTPNTNYALDTLIVTDGNGDPVTVTNNTFTMPDSAVTVTANFYETYKIWIGNVQVTEKNKADILGDGSVVYEGNQTEGTLTLTNAEITAKTSTSLSENVFVYNNNLSLTLMLAGENTIGVGNATYALELHCHDVTVTGDGSLDVHGSYEGIITNCPVVIDSTTVSVNADDYFGMEINSSSLTIKDSNVSSEGSNMAISASYLDIDNSTVNAYARATSYALYGASGIRIKDSTVVANSTYHYGIATNSGGLTITNSKVTASSIDDTGINVSGNCTITNSTVETTGVYQGIKVANGSLNINGRSELTANSRNDGYAAVLADNIVLGDDIYIVTPENGIINSYNYNNLKTVYESDGTSLADTVKFKYIQTHANNNYSLTLDDGIAVNFYIDTPFYEAEGGRIKYSYLTTTDDKSAERSEYEVNVDDLVQSDGKRKLTLQAAPAQLAEKYIITVYDENGEPKDTIEASIEDYCKQILANDSFAEWHDVTQSLLNYGALADEYFGYAALSKAVTGNDYAISHSYDYKDDVNAESFKSRAKAHIEQGDVNISGVSYVALLNPEFRFYISNLTEDEAAAINVSIDKAGLTAEMVKTDNGICVRVTGLNASDFAKTFTVTVGTTEITYNGYAYLYTVLRDGSTESEALKDLTKGIYRYAAACEAKFA